MKPIFTFIICTLALLLALTGCNIAPTPAETTEEITQGELTSEEVTTEAVTTEAGTTEKKEVNTDLGNVPSGDITVIQGKNKDEFLQEYENSEVSKNGRYPIKNSIITEALIFEALQGVLELEPFGFGYREYPEAGFDFEFELFMGEDFNWVPVRMTYRPNGHGFSLSKPFTPFDESNGIYYAPFEDDTAHSYIAYLYILNDQTYIDFSIRTNNKNFEEIRTVLLDYVAEIKEIANREVTESTP